ncbi:helix-turn-helix domain-containing protein [Clostridium sp. OF09-36]|uniref:helix-turn-helix domain-containing protein n=1 Tax=Clostridium sp. OF09-36 TaxID=2292310 RepID=UPI000E47BEFF|nr:helix-turn-helix transcriptional regulator [Clostridium sp. OF09-36]RHV89391.1 helix-turn-helix domain-containing protein [Clostridium sp. OF09-36]HBM46981.1 XRE family transcriptional regulator [Lachnoclostridium sp.]
MPEEIYKKIFSKNLNHYMEINQKSQTDIINDLGFNKSAVSTWCNGTRLPRMDKVEALAKYFGINRSDLIEEKDNAETSDEPYYLNDETRQIAQEAFENPELRTLFHVARDIPPERLKAHIEFMKSLKAQEKGDPDEPC